MSLDLLALTHERYVWPGLRAACKESAIELLLDSLLGAGALPVAGRDEVLEAILARERRLATGLEYGIAIPHGTTHLVEREVAAVGIFPDGVQFDAVDGQSTRIVILLVTPQIKRDRHVINLARVAGQLLRPQLRLALLEAVTRDEAIEALRSHS